MLFRSATGRKLPSLDNSLQIDSLSNTNDFVCNSELLEYDIDEELLEKNFNHLNKRRILVTQNLSEEFCAKYMFCIDDIHEGSEDSYLYGFNDIMYYQPHLNKTKFIEMLKKYKKI